MYYYCARAMSLSDMITYPINKSICFTYYMANIMQLGNYVVEVSELVHKPYAYGMLITSTSLLPLKKNKSCDICMVKGQ